MRLIITIAVLAVIAVSLVLGQAGNKRENQRVILGAKEQKSKGTVAVLTPKTSGYCRYRGSGTNFKELVKDEVRNWLPEMGFQERVSLTGSDFQTLKEILNEIKRDNSQSSLTELDYALVPSVNIICNDERYNEPFSRSTVIRHVDKITVRTSLIRISDQILVAQGEGRASGSQTGVNNRYGRRNPFNFDSNLLTTAVGGALRQVSSKIKENDKK